MASPVTLFVLSVSIRKSAGQQDANDVSETIKNTVIAAIRKNMATVLEPRRPKKILILGQTEDPTFRRASQWM